MTDGDDDAAEFPPRGSGEAGRVEAPPASLWGYPEDLGENWNWKPGKVLLGQQGDRLIGDPDREEEKDGETVARLGDDRHIVTIAGSRAGKSRTVLLPNLRRYPGSVFVIDPKGELARATARLRAEVFGQQVVVLDPFGASGVPGASYNPLDELNPKSETFIDDAGLVADALIIDGKGDAHWTDSARTLILAIILFMFATGGACTLPRLRRILLGEEGVLSRPEGEDDEDGSLFVRMAKHEEAFEGLLALFGQSFLDKSERELSSIVSTAREQTRFLDAAPMRRVLQPSTLRFAELKSRPTTVYACLPAARLATHHRWLRLLLTLGLIALEHDQTRPQHPVLLILEEFAALETLRPLERAAGFMAGFDVRLWTVLQDLGQLKAHYRESWETFLGNAGVVQLFGNADLTTTEHVSKLLGRTVVMERQDVRVSASGLDRGDLGMREVPRAVNLLDPFEVTRWFARETGRQLLLVPGRPPLFLERMDE
jgi:type IV secretion system protein VirD4